MHLRSASEKQKKIATIITFFTIPLSGFMTDVYLPSFPSMARDLSVSETSIQLTLTCFFLSYGFAQEHAMWSDGIIPDSYFKLTLINPF